MGGDIKKCPVCFSSNLRYSERGFTITNIKEGWMCNNCRLLFGYGTEEGDD